DDRRGERGGAAQGADEGAPQLAEGVDRGDGPAPPQAGNAGEEPAEEEQRRQQDADVEEHLPHPAGQAGDHASEQAAGEQPGHHREQQAGPLVGGGTPGDRHQDDHGEELEQVDDGSRSDHAPDHPPPGAGHQGQPHQETGLPGPGEVDRGADGAHHRDQHGEEHPGPEGRGTADDERQRQDQRDAHLEGEGAAPGGDHQQLAAESSPGHDAGQDGPARGRTWERAARGPPADRHRRVHREPRAGITAGTPISVPFPSLPTRAWKHSRRSGRRTSRLRTPEPTESAAATSRASAASSSSSATTRPSAAESSTTPERLASLSVTARVSAFCDHAGPGLSGAPPGGLDPVAGVVEAPLRPWAASPTRSSTIRLRGTSASSSGSGATRRKRPWWSMATRSATPATNSGSLLATTVVSPAAARARSAAAR